MTDHFPLVVAEVVEHDEHHLLLLVEQREDTVAEEMRGNKRLASSLPLPRRSD